jgi:hypothetical protein
MGFIAVKRVKQRLLKAVRALALSSTTSSNQDINRTASREPETETRQRAAAFPDVPLPSGCGKAKCRRAAVITMIFLVTSLAILITRTHKREAVSNAARSLTTTAPNHNAHRKALITMIAINH